MIGASNISAVEDTHTISPSKISFKNLNSSVQLEDLKSPKLGSMLMDSVGGESIQSQL